MRIRVAAVQMSSQARLESNLARMAEQVARAADAGARLVLLPESFAYLGDERGKRAIAEALSRTESATDGPMTRALRIAACQHKVWLIAGGIPEQSGDRDRPYNSCVVFAPDGAIAARYHKIHLFDVDVGDGVRSRESAATSPGTEPVVATLDRPALKVGLSVCYDLRFPELYRRLVDGGAELLVVPAAFTLATGKDHWLALLRARAIESQCYLLAAAQWGKHGRRLTSGKSCLVDPWGDVVAQASEGEGIVTGEVDLDYLAAVRKSLPALEHRVL
jgi:deaminated glutathione amidase